MIVFVGSNPSRVGPNSPAIRNLRKWWEILGVDNAKFINVSTVVTPDNRPLKNSEYELDRLRADLGTFSKVVALGGTASDALSRLGILHFRLPHPSPRNRQLNDQISVRRVLLECKKYLED